MIRKFFIFLLIIIFSFTGFCWYAASPFLSEREFASFNQVKFEKNLDESNVSPSLDKVGRIKIVSYNIGYAWGDKNNLSVQVSKSEVENNLRIMAENLKKLNADILCLQEVDFQSARTFDINQFEYLAKALRMPYGAYAVTWNKKYLPWPYWPPQNQYGHMFSGQVILSRFPIEEQALLKFEKPSSNPFWYNWFYLERMAQKVSIQIGAQKLALWNIHLEAFDPKTRETQIQILSKEIESEKNPIKIVAGDFNSPSRFQENLNAQDQKELEDKGEILKEFSKLTDLQNAEKKEIFYTMPSWKPVKKIDHLFYNPAQLKLEETGTVSNLLSSDHLPVWGSFVL